MSPFKSLCRTKKEIQISLNDEIGKSVETKQAEYADKQLHHKIFNLNL